MKKSTVNEIKHSFLFKPHLAPLVFNGQKIETRRLLSYRNTLVDGRRWNKKNFAKLDIANAWIDNSRQSPAGNPGPYIKASMLPEHGDTTHRLYPIWQPGDHAWAREKWRIYMWRLETSEFEIQYSDTLREWHEMPDDIDNAERAVNYQIQCSDECEAAGVPLNDEDCYYYDLDHPCPTKWRSSLYMPFWACRSILRIRRATPQRLQDMTNCEIVYEGIQPVATISGAAKWRELKDRWRRLWDDINAARGASWKSNPLIWAIQFNKLNN